MKVATFTLRASMPQSIRWKRAAEGEGFASVGSWAARALDAYMEHRTRAGRPLPLAWHLGRSRVLLDGGEVSVKGHISPPFFAFRGTAAGPDPRSNNYTLTLLSDGRIVATLRTYHQCRVLAAELAPLLIRDEHTGAVVERHVHEQA